MASETSLCRPRLAKYCQGSVVDLGAGGDPIVPWAITVDLEEPYSHEGNAQVNLKGDARNLYWFQDGCLDSAFCVVPGDNSLVNTSKGYKNIEHVKVGDHVLDFYGSYSEVQETYERNYSGKTIIIYAKGIYSPIELTPNHTMPVERNGEIVWVKAEEVRVTDRVMVPVTHECNSGVTSVKITDIINGERLKKYSESIKMRENGKNITEIRLALNVPRSTVWQWYTGKKMPFGIYLEDNDGYVIGTNGTKVRNNIVIDRDFMKLVGYYLSDGCANKRKMGATVEFYFGGEEAEYVEDVKRIMFEKFGIKPIKSGIEKTNMIKVRYCSVTLCRFFREFIAYPGKKDIPDWAMSQSNVNLEGLVEGMFNGDGSWNDRNGYFSSKDKSMAIKLRDILLRLGIRSKISYVNCEKYNQIINGRKINSKGMYIVNVTSDFDKLSVILGVEAKIKKYIRSMAEIKNNLYFTRIHKIELGSYQGKVYNLKVASHGENSYTVNGIAVHNSSHLLEDFEDTVPVLREWLRVVRPGGHLVLFCPNEQVYRKHCDATGQVYNTFHRIPEFSLEYLLDIVDQHFKDQVTVVHQYPLINSYSFELVLQKVAQ